MPHFQTTRSRRSLITAVAFVCALAPLVPAQNPPAGGASPKPAKPGKPAPPPTEAKPAHKSGRRAHVKIPTSVPTSLPTSMPVEPLGPETLQMARQRLGRSITMRQRMLRPPPAAGATQRPARRGTARGAKPAPTSQPATPTSNPMETESKSAIIRHLQRDMAFVAGLDFLLACAAGDGHKAADLVDVVGYQPLPLTGELPERAQRPIPPENVEQTLTGRARAEIGKLDISLFEIVRAPNLKVDFPAVATWMLEDEDFAVVCHAPVGGATANWVTRDACVVVRLRGEHPTIVAGNLLEALGAKTLSKPADGEDK